MATYKQIQKDIHSVHNLAIKSCWLAHVKKFTASGDLEPFLAESTQVHALDSSDHLLSSQ